ncbi:MBL fold metallo-hydrolase [Aestuariivirga sp.]|uniref:MBL fold metallo-hydrolase n=1 Tax=Aestuariivirga sp. TaxID=2650926 RepID=UPI0025C0CBCE|nr:MBL fold metallo-hydrolase [Aestuariivirga sp.]MCA3554715.1 MBL fold metallo-hydrolase [Aestuariivirga sp.]
MIRLKFHGAARTVTGSCYLIETERARVLVDCGMFQGSKTERGLNYRPFPFDAAAVSAVLLTHAHIDHSGLLPKLVKHGYRGRIHCTAATADLCAIMLPDSGNIQEMEVKQLNQRRSRRGQDEVEPIYTQQDAVDCLSQFEGHAYETWIAPAPGIRARYWNAGHLLGSASVEVEVEQQGSKPVRLLFSGDLGPDNKMLEHDPEAPANFDFIVCESTYGGRDRFERSEDGRREILAREVNGAAGKKGALLIPSFAVERTQELVTDLVRLMDGGQAPRATIFIDSPLASKATAIFVRHAGELQHGGDLTRAFTSPYVRITESVEDSKALARFTGFRIIVSASGMCEAGRIRHHLKNHLWQPSTTVLLAGFQAEGSLGRILQDGARSVTIMGEEISVKAAIRQIGDYSGHADGPELVQWVKERLPVGRSIFLTHGEEEGQRALAQDLRGLGLPHDCIFMPTLDSVYDLSGEACAFVAEDTHPRIDPAMVARFDSHNDMAELILDIKGTVDKAGGEKARAVILRRLRRALAGGDGTSPDATRRRPPVSGPSRRSRGWDEG